MASPGDPPAMGHQHYGIQGTAQHVGPSYNSTYHMHNHTPAGDRFLDYLGETDPQDVRTRIHQTRGDVLKESYGWILNHRDFERWRDGMDSQLLWIKGDPGKGKTMLLSGIIGQLRPDTKLANDQAKTLLSFFFCQATDPKLSNAFAVLRGLIYMVVDTQQPSLRSHVRGKFKDTGEPRFGDAEAWAALCNIFLSILRDSSLEKIIVIIDALDECVQDRDKLLKFVLQEANLPRVKWIISSRNCIEQRTRLEHSQSILSLELQQNANSVSQAIEAYIANRTSQLKSLRNDPSLQSHVRQVLRKKAEGTFLWVALVVQELENVRRWKVRQVVDDVPKGLDSLYARMIEQIEGPANTDTEYCRLLLSAATLAYRPLRLLELGAVSGLPDEISSNIEDIREIVEISGSFLTIRDGIVYFVHQSAKDYLVGKAASTIFPSGSAAAHRGIFTQSLQVMRNTLRRDMHDLHYPGTPIDRAKQLEQNPLAAAGYSCIYWVDHLEESVTSGLYEDLQDGGAVDTFLRKQYLYWLEALSLLRSMTEGIMSVQKLERLLQGRTGASGLSGLIRDAHRFILYHKGIIENRPLQIYGSALVFSPSRSIIKGLFQHEARKWITTEPVMEGNWDAHSGACLQTLEGHSDEVHSVAFSHDSRRIASASRDRTVKIWDAATGACLQTFEGHNASVSSVTFSHDSRRIASASDDRTVKIWDAATGACLQTFVGHSDEVRSVTFSHDGCRIASASRDRTVKIWNAATGACLQTFEGHNASVSSVAFSYDGRRIASTSGNYTRDHTVKIWDVATGACLQTFEGRSYIDSLSFDLAGSSLVTNIGVVALFDSPEPQRRQNAPKPQESQKPQYRGYGISSHDVWIVRNSQNWLWLPREYRPECSAVALSGLTLAIGCRSGRVLIFGFSAEACD